MNRVGWIPGSAMRRLLLFLGCLSGSTGFCDGGFFGKGGVRREAVSSPAQKAVILRERQAWEALLLQTTYRGPSADFAWVIPVPGLPSRDGVFLADPMVFDVLDEITRPRTEIVLRDPLRGNEILIPGKEGLLGGMGVGGPGGAGGPGMPPRVIVHERMEVGDYDVSILSATGRGVLVDWLNRNGYAYPRVAEKLADDYVSRGWHFVALRIASRTQEKTMVLKEVAPVGLWFPSEKLVFPLTLSKVSAPPRTTLLLFVLDAWGSRCAELPAATFPQATKGKRGSTYADLVRGLAAKQPGQQMVCEAVVRMGPWPKEIIVTADKDGKKPLPLGNYTASRFRAETKRESMKDLTFTPVAGRGFTLKVTARADVPTPALAYWFGTANARKGWLLVCFGLLVLFSLFPLRTKGEGWFVKSGRVVFWVFVASLGVCWLIYLYPESAIVVFCLCLLVLVAWEVLWRLILVTTEWAAIVSPRGMSVARTLLCAAVAGVLAFEVVPRSCDRVLQRIRPDGRDVVVQQTNALMKLDGALKSFRKATGAYPVRLSELTAHRTPKRGLDASGNKVPITGSAALPLLRGIPTDPLTGRNDTWVYDVCSPSVVESGGYEVTVTTERSHTG